MSRSSALKILRLALCAALLAGCAAVQRSTPTAPPVPHISHTPYVMAPLDLVRVRTDGAEPEILQITQDGTLELNGESRPVVGMPVEKFRALLRNAYPHARDMEIVEFRPNRVSVLGEVFHQIHTDLGDGPMRVMDGIAAANGFTPLANKRRVRLIRENAGTVQVFELDLREMMQGNNINQNLLLNPGDVITVPRNFL